MKTFFMIKPDGVQRNLIGQIISRVEAKGFNITKIKMMILVLWHLMTPKES